jgi:hypothetical protein
LGQGETGAIRKVDGLYKASFDEESVVVGKHYPGSFFNALAGVKEIEVSESSSRSATHCLIRQTGDDFIECPQAYVRARTHLAKKRLNQSSVSSPVHHKN